MDISLYIQHTTQIIEIQIEMIKRKYNYKNCAFELLQWTKTVANKDIIDLYIKFFTTKNCRKFELV
jgi:hypothetical protein